MTDNHKKMSVEAILAASRRADKGKRAQPSPDKPAPAADQQPLVPEGQREASNRGTVQRESRAGHAPRSANTSVRRGFFRTLFGSSLAIGFTSLVVTNVVWLLGLARFMFPNVLIESPTKFKVGPPDNYPPGYVETKYKSQFGVWIVHDQYEGEQQLYALEAVCTHLGCIPHWLASEEKFKCPCHGSGFYKDGINFEGPAPRPLERFAIRIAEDGQLEVDKSRKFHQELGQWSDPASFVRV